MYIKNFKLLAIIFSLAINNVWSMELELGNDEDFKAICEVKSSLDELRRAIINDIWGIKEKLDQLIKVAVYLDSLPDDYPDPELLLSKKIAKEYNLKETCEGMKSKLYYYVTESPLWDLFGDHYIPMMIDNLILMREQAALREEDAKRKREINSLLMSLDGLEILLRTLTSKDCPDEKK